MSITQGATWADFVLSLLLTVLLFLRFRNRNPEQRPVHSASKRAKADDKEMLNPSALDDPDI